MIMKTVSCNLSPSVFVVVAFLVQVMMISSQVAKAVAASGTKQLFILRHGQATHNPRAEVARANGCSQEEFMELMRQDDSLDAELTPMGKEQAKSVNPRIMSQEETMMTKEGGGKKIQLVVSSPLSRAIQTADLAIPRVENRVCIEEFREINGWLLNAQRRARSELRELYKGWSFDALTTEEDKLWTTELESQSDCAERGYQGLRWILRRPEDTIFLVCHGGILRFTMNQHNLVKMVDGRSHTSSSESPRPVNSRFGNCELRRYSIGWDDDDDDEKTTIEPDTDRRTITLIELDQE